MRLLIGLLLLWTLIFSLNRKLRIYMMKVLSLEES